MSFYENLFIDVVLILFPIFIYLLYVAYSNNLELKKNELFFDFVNYTLLYIMLNYKMYFDDTIYLLLLNIPLILCFLKKRTISAIIISLLIVYITFTNYHFLLLFILLEYLLYFWLYIFIYYKKNNFEMFITCFLFIKGIILSYETFYILPTNLSVYTIIIRTFIILILFYAITSLVVILLKKGEEILFLNKVLKELEKEKCLRSSLFKITHEIKNPLAVCKGYLDMMNYDDINKAKKYSTIIKNEIERSLDLMDDFLDYTKIKVNLSIMDINMLIDDVTSSIKSLIINKNIKLIKKIKDDEIFIDGDYNRLKQVFINVIKNSIEAIESKKGIIEIEEKEFLNNIIITIKDNGCGMSKETLQRINETFFTTKEKGTGLGVTLSTEIIKLHNGKIEYESKEYKGTKTIITLHKSNTKF